MDHEGRPALETMVSAHSRLPALGSGGSPVPARPHPVGRPWHGRLRGQPFLEDDTAGYGHWLRILAVDEYMLDDLFLAESMNLTDVRRHISLGRRRAGRWTRLSGCVRSARLRR